MLLGRNAFAANPAIDTGSYNEAEGGPGTSVSVPLKCSSGEELYLVISYTSVTGISSAPSSPTNVGTFTKVTSANYPGSVGSVEVWRASTTGTINTNCTVTYPITTESQVMSFAVANDNGIGATNTASQTTAPTGTPNISTTGSNSLVFGVQANYNINPPQGQGGKGTGTGWVTNTTLDEISDTSNMGMTVLWAISITTTIGTSKTPLLGAGYLTGNYGLITFEIKGPAAASSGGSELAGKFYQRHL